MSVDEKDPGESVEQMEERMEEHLKDVDKDLERVDKLIHDAEDKRKEMYKMDEG